MGVILGPYRGSILGVKNKGSYWNSIFGVHIGGPYKGSILGPYWGAILGLGVHIGGPKSGSILGDLSKIGLYGHFRAKIVIFAINKWPFNIAKIGLNWINIWLLFPNMAQWGKCSITVR
jgi:hypothetical protein